MVLKKENMLCWLIIFAACSTPEQTGEKTIWYKGNTHAHTTLCGHADTAPDTVAAWYLDRGYNFLILSEHNIFINPDSVLLPEPRRSDFILIPGQEVTGHKHIHTTAMNTDHLVLDKTMKTIPEGLSAAEQLQEKIRSLRVPIEETRTEIMQRHTSDIREAGGVPILNHPNFVTGAQANEILEVDHLHMIELYNGHPHVFNWGNDEHVSVEEKWDSLLSAGKLVLGISSDDAHHFKEYDAEQSNPGRGWVMVDSDGNLETDAITDAMARGQFYSTSGVMLAEISHTPSEYEIEIDEAATAEELASPYVIGKISDAGTEGFQTTFIGKDGVVLQQTDEGQTSFAITDEKSYVRAKVSYTRKLEDGKYETFFAWTQPRFLDGRAEMLESGGIYR